MVVRRRRPDDVPRRAYRETDAPVAIPYERSAARADETLS